MAIHQTHITLPRRELRDPDGIYERYCPQCGKVFVVQSPGEWCYRAGHKLFCSWSCYREKVRGVPPHPGTKAVQAIAEVKSERQHRQHYDPTAALAQTREIIRMREQGLRNEEIAEKLGLSKGVVAQRLTKYGRQLGWQPKTKKEAGMAGVEAKRKKRKKKEGKE